MKRIVLVFLMFLFYIVLKSQDIKLSLQTGYGFYDMSSLKDITKSAMTQIPFVAKTIANYPPFLYYQPMIRFCGKNVEIGFLYTNQSTGSRISSKDYSGEYRLDTRIHSNSPAVILNLTKDDFDNFKLWWSLKLGANFTSFKMTEYMHLTGGTTNENSTDLVAGALYFEPGVNISVPVNKFSIELNFAYQKEVFRNDLQTKDNPNEGISLKKNFMESDLWDGFRLGITVAYTLSGL